MDLAGFLAQHGYTADDNDDPRWRALSGPGGKILVHVPGEGSGKDWMWNCVGTSNGGTIYDACEKLLGLIHGRTVATLRRAVAQPPPALPLRRTFTAAADPARSHEARQPRRLAQLMTAGADYLMGPRCLEQTTVEAFAHRLRSDPLTGHLVAPHNNHGDGEEHIPQADGSVKKRFIGSRDDGPDRGRSLWHGFPKKRETAKGLLVAESVVDAMSAWRLLDAYLQPQVQVVSTAGDLGDAAKRKLIRLVQQMQTDLQRAGGGQLILADASDVGEPNTEKRTAALRKIADYCGAKYIRCETTHGKDWNDAVVAARYAQEAVQDAAQEPTADKTGLDPEMSEELGQAPNNPRPRPRRI